MTDAAYVFKQTVGDRKRNARGAYAKKGGSRSRRCSLPSDNLTEKQRKELNGKVESYTLKPMTWVEFLQMPERFKKEYIERLVKEYEARPIDLASMFGTTVSNFYNYINRHFKCSFWGKRGSSKTSSKWTAFVSTRNDLVPDDPEPIESITVVPAASPAVKLYAPEEKAEVMLKCLEGQATYEGNPAAIFAKVLQIMEPNKNYGLEITWWEVKDDA